MNAPCILCWLLLAGCTRNEGRRVEYFLPDDYRGEFVIIENKHAAPLPIENGAEICRIPTNGVLHAERLTNFRRWHAVGARYFSGHSIPVRFTSDPEVAPNEVCVYELGDAGSRLEFFVGTHSEMMDRVRHPPAQTEAEEFWSGGALKYRRVTNNLQQSPTPTRGMGTP